MTPHARSFPPFSRTRNIVGGGGLKRDKTNVLSPTCVPSSSSSSLFLLFLRRQILVRYQKEEEKKKEPNFRRRRIGLLPFLLFPPLFYSSQKLHLAIVLTRSLSTPSPFHWAASQHNNCHVTVQQQGFYFPCFEHAFLREKPLLLPIHSAKANQSRRNIKWRAHAASPYYYYFVTLRGQLLRWYWRDLGFGIGL